VPLDSKATARRFVLGRQGLWPGRRWEGRRGLTPALRYVGSVQFDPLNVVGRSHDLALWGRIVGYQTEHLEDALYKTRTAFETAGNVQILPIAELPYLRVVMHRKIAEGRWGRFARAKAGLLRRVMSEIEQRGPLGPSDFEGHVERRIQNYRARKESGLALYYLWLKGDIMIAFRRHGEKIFDLTDRVLRGPLTEVPIPEAEDHLILETLRHLGLATPSEWLRYAWPRIGRITLRKEWPNLIRRWRDQDIFREIEVDGWKGQFCISADAFPELETLRSLEVPPSWRPRATTSEEEVVFLAPLEVVSSSGRAARLFDFEYIWEVYKPASTRRWGYYTMPILYGDRLSARIEMRYEGTVRTLRILGFWPEEASPRRDPAFASALGRALRRLAEFNGAANIVVAGLRSPVLERQVLRAADEDA
jgi:uncharacterized protein